MDAVISFTPAQVFTSIISLCGLITGVAAVVALIISGVKKAKQPNIIQDQRIQECETRITKIEEALLRDLNRFEKLEDGNAIMIEGMLALLRHGIDGNDIQSMKDAQDKLNQYLIHKNRVV